MERPAGREADPGGRAENASSSSASSSPAQFDEARPSAYPANEHATPRSPPKPGRLLSPAAGGGGDLPTRFRPGSTSSAFRGSRRYRRHFRCVATVGLSSSTSCGQRSYSERTPRRRLIRPRSRPRPRDRDPLVPTVPYATASLSLSKGDLSPPSVCRLPPPRARDPTSRRPCGSAVSTSITSRSLDSPTRPRRAVRRSTRPIDDVSIPRTGRAMPLVPQACRSHPRPASSPADSPAERAAPIAMVTAYDARGASPTRRAADPRRRLGA